ncbi:MAG: hypothetical protein HXX19_21120 [Rhodoferax sp.]|nr:hypothetical protein [Rhodoferax sp.]
MESDSPQDTVARDADPRQRAVWHTTLELKPGMVLAKPVSASSGGYATMQLSAGVMLTEETIGQMIVKGLECVAVVNTDPPGEKAYAQVTEQYTARLQQIFGPQPNAHCQALLDALLRRGPMPC